MWAAYWEIRGSTKVYIFQPGELIAAVHWRGVDADIDMWLHCSFPSDAENKMDVEANRVSICKQDAPARGHGAHGQVFYNAMYVYATASRVAMK